MIIKKRHFWNLSLFSIFLAMVLVIVVIANLIIAMEVRNPFAADTNLLHEELAAVKKENTELKKANISLAHQVVICQLKSCLIRMLLDKIQPVMERLLKLSRCVTCCQVTAEIISMETHFQEICTKIQEIQQEVLK